MAVETITVVNTGGTNYKVQADDVGTDDYMQVVKLGVQTLGTTGIAPGDAIHGLKVSPSIRMVTLSATPGMTAASYIAGEQIGAVNTFTGAAAATGESGTILSAVMSSALANTVVPDLDLFLFEVSPTLVGANDSAFDITDANLVTARCAGVIEFKAADYQTLANNTVCWGTVTGSAALAVPFVTATTANMFGVLVARSAFTGATNANVITLRIAQD